MERYWIILVVIGALGFVGSMAFIQRRLKKMQKLLLESLRIISFMNEQHKELIKIQKELLKNPTKKEEIDTSKYREVTEFD